MEENNKIPIYTDNDGLTKIDVKLEEDTLWLTQAQMCATEHRKYKQRTLSDVEQDYLNAIKAISDKSKKGGKK